MRIRLMLLPVLAAAALLAGCQAATPAASTSPSPTDNGVSALSATEILAKAKEALKKAPSYTVAGKGSTDGGKMAIDMQFKGANKKGSITTDGMVIELVQLDGFTYFKAPDALWSSMLSGQAAALSLLKGKYVKFASDDAKFGSLTQGLDPDGMLTPEGTLGKGEATTIDGHAAITLTSTTAGGKVNKLFIATTGEPLPLRVADTDGDINFTYGADITITAPPADQVFDISALMPK